MHKSFGLGQTFYFRLLHSNQTAQQAAFNGARTRERAKLFAVKCISNKYMQKRKRNMAMAMAVGKKTHNSLKEHRQTKLNHLWCVQHLHLSTDNNSTNSEGEKKLKQKT